MGLDMRVLPVKELHAFGIATLGLDPEVCDLFSMEAIAASIRRAAGFLCPCPQRALVQAVVESLEPLDPNNRDQLVESVENTLESMIAYGDLLEEFEVGVVEQSNRSSLLYAAPPSFVPRESGIVFLVGIAPDHISPLTERLEKRIDYLNHVRRLFPHNDENLGTELKQLGLAELSIAAWLKRAPRHESSSEHLRRISSKLRPASGVIEGLRMLNSERPVTHYRRRWEQVQIQTGRFVARRPQPYGNDLWCYVELKQGRAIRLLDFPIEGGDSRGCDEAWRLQLAIDAERTMPQCFAVREEGNFYILDFFSPLPMFAVRRWTTMGEPVTTTRGLFAYKFRSDEISEEIKFMQHELWLDQTHN
jgi:hypothetical protein